MVRLFLWSSVGLEQDHVETMESSGIFYVTEKISA